MYKKIFLLFVFVLVIIGFFFLANQVKALVSGDTDSNAPLGIQDVTVVPGGSVNVSLSAPRGYGFINFKSKINECAGTTRYSNVDGCYAWIGNGGASYTFVYPAPFFGSSYLTADPNTLSPFRWGQGFTIKAASNTPAGTYTATVNYLAGRWGPGGHVPAEPPCCAYGSLSFRVTVPSTLTIDPSSLSRNVGTYSSWQVFPDAIQVDVKENNSSIVDKLNLSAVNAVLTTGVVSLTSLAINVGGTQNDNSGPSRLYISVPDSLRNSMNSTQATGLLSVKYQGKTVTAPISINCSSLFFKCILSVSFSVNSTSKDGIRITGYSIGPITINQGDKINLKWSSSYLGSCVGTNFNTGNTISGNKDEYPIADKTYTITCTNSAGDSVSKSVVVKVNTLPAPTLTLTANPPSLTIPIGKSELSTITVNSSNISGNITLISYPNDTFASVPLSSSSFPGNSGNTLTSTTTTLTVTAIPGSQSGTVRVTGSGTGINGTTIYATPNPLVILVTVTAATKPNLTASAPPQNTATVGVAKRFTSTISNIGNASTGATFFNSFQIAGAKDGVYPVTPLNPTNLYPTTLPLAASGTIEAFIDYPFTGSAGERSVRFCADKNTSMVGTINESNEDNNCSPWTNVTVTTPITAPTCISPTATNITSTTATLGANITSNGGASITAHGICLGTNSTPLGCQNDGAFTTGIFTQNRTGLSPNTLYYYRGYATNSANLTGYSADATFTTLAPVDGVCSSPMTAYNCSAGRSANNAINGVTSTWNCNGLNGGANVSCSQVMSGRLTSSSPSCVITSGDSGCSVDLAWDTTNPQGISAVTSSYPSSGSVVANANSGFSTPVFIPYSSRTFYLYNNNNLLNPPAGLTITASRAKSTITAIQAPNGRITPEGVTSVIYGSSQAYSITPNSGYYVKSLIIDSIPIAGASSYTFINVTSNKTITAEFKPTDCVNGAVNPPACNICTSPQVWNGSSCIAPLSISTPANSTITLPTTAFSAAYTLTNGTSSNTDCYLLDNNLALLKTDNACNSPMTYNTPATAGTYGYYMRAVKASTGETKTSNMFTVTVSAAPTCANGANNPPACTTFTPCSNGANNPPTCTNVMSGTLTGPSSCTIPSGGSVCSPSPTLNWSIANPEATPTAITASGMSNINVSNTLTTPQSGTQTVTVPYSSRTFYLYNKAKSLVPTSPNGSGVVITATCASGTEWKSSGKCLPIATPISVSISASPQSMTLPSNSTTLNWKTNGSPTSCNATGDWSGAKAIPKGSENRTGLTAGSYTYTITCSKSGVPNTTGSVTVTVNPALTMSGILNANPPSCTIASGGNSCSTTLTWSTTNPIGTSAITSSYPSTNTIIATGNSGGMAVLIPHSSGNPLLAQASAAIPYGSRDFYLYNNGELLDQVIVTSDCVGGTFWDNGKCTVIPSPPTASISLSSGNITSGDPLTITWSSSNATSCTGTGFNTGGATSGSVVVYPTTTTTYFLSCNDGATQAFDQATVTVSATSKEPKWKEN